MRSSKSFRNSQGSGGTSSAVVGKTLIYSGDINDNFVTFLWENLLKQGVDLWNKKSGAAKESRRLILSSAGGSPENVLSIVDLFEHIEDLTTCATGTCMSAAVPIVAAGSADSRYATPRTRFMVHSPVWDNEASTRKFSQVHVQELKLLEDQFADVLTKYTRKSRKFWLGLLKRDEGYFFNAEEAKELGVIDKIVEAPFS